VLRGVRMGFLRMEKVAKERMTSLDSENVIPQVVLSVKPIIAVEAGKVETADKPRTRSKSRERCIELICARPIERIAILHTMAPDVEEFKAEVVRRGGLDEAGSVEKFVDRHTHLRKEDDSYAVAGNGGARDGSGEVDGCFLAVGPEGEAAGGEREGAVHAGVHGASGAGGLPGGADLQLGWRYGAAVGQPPLRAPGL